MGSCPEAPDLEQDEGCNVCVCVSRGGQGRRQHPGRTLGTQFPAAVTSLLLRLHKSLPAGSVLPSSGGFPLFPRLCPASSDSFSLPNDPGFERLLPLSVPSQGCGTLSMSPSVSSDVQEARPNDGTCCCTRDRLWKHWAQINTKSPSQSSYCVHTVENETPVVCGAECDMKAVRY